MKHKVTLSLEETCPFPAENPKKEKKNLWSFLVCTNITNGLDFVSEQHGMACPLHKPEPWSRGGWELGRGGGGAPTLH